MKFYQLIIIIYLFTYSINIKASPWEAALIDSGEWSEQPEAKNLPPFCGTNPRYKNFKSNFTSAYLNHPCESLVRRNICFRFTGQDKNNCFMAISKGFTYTLKNDPDPKMPLRPWLYCEAGLTYFYAENYKNAVQAYTESIKINKKYLRAYSGLSDVYVKLKNYDQATEIIEQGLKIDPNSKKLNSKKEKLLQKIKNKK